jgi:hypothetical protein
MKKVVLAAAILAISFSVSAKGGRGGHSHSARPASGTGSKAAHSHVSGYTKKSGAYVAAHDRSTRDSTKTNNWSTKGNVNPETGKKGAK